MDRKQAAIEAANGPSLPLLGATVVACMAFYPIFASDLRHGRIRRWAVHGGGHFAAVELGLLPDGRSASVHGHPAGPKPGQAAVEPYQGALYRGFRKLLALTIRYRVIFLASMVGLLVISVLGFRAVPQLYFPSSSRLQLMIDYWAPEGTRIQQTSADLQRIEPSCRSTPPPPRSAPSSARDRRVSICPSAPRIRTLLRSDHRQYEVA
jgi:multidrug efflux pump subunit AcrB